MVSTVRVSSLDSSLHNAIDLLQAMVLDIELLKQKPEVTGTELEKVFHTLMQRAFECSNLLHEARQDVRDIDSKVPKSTFESLYSPEFFKQRSR